jgi:hypothetical protein
MSNGLAIGPAGPCTRKFPKMPEYPTTTLFSGGAEVRKTAEIRALSAG